MAMCLQLGQTREVGEADRALATVGQVVGEGVKVAKLSCTDGTLATGRLVDGEGVCGGEALQADLAPSGGRGDRWQMQALDAHRR